jgi:hypothetical protein
VTPRRLLPALACAVVLAGCVQVGQEGSELACSTGDEGHPANGVVLMAQAVGSATQVPCLDAVPSGWHLSDVDIRNDSGRLWLDSDRDGVRAIEVVLTASCDVGRAVEIPSEHPDARRYELVTQVSPTYAGTRYYVFTGGCLAIHLRPTGPQSSEPLAVASEAVDLVRRTDVEKVVRDESHGRLELDPTPAADGAP